MSAFTEATFTPTGRRRGGRELVRVDGLAFDIGRKPSLAIGFGHGVHSCLGAALARMESRIAIEELLRYESPVPSGMRYPEVDVDLGNGLIVPAGEQVNAFWAAANVDPTYHDDPLRVDFDREKFGHMTFASGIHRCLGSHLARLELRIVLEELLSVVGDFTLDPEALRYDNVAVRTVTSIPIAVR